MLQQSGGVDPRRFPPFLGAPAPQGEFGDRNGPPQGAAAAIAALINMQASQPALPSGARPAATVPQSAPQSGPSGMMFAGAPGAPAPGGYSSAQPVQQQGAPLMPDGAEKMPLDLAGLNTPLNMAEVGTRHPSFFQHGGLGGKLLQGVGEFATQYSASQGDRAALLTLQNRNENAQQGKLWQRQDTQRTQDRRWQVEDRDAKLHQPQYFMSGKDRVAYDPTTNESNVIYDGPEDYQNYADTLGLSPDDEGYDAAVKDFVLRGNGPTALEGRQSLEGARQQNRMTLRSTPTYANLHPTPRAPRAPGGRGGMAFTGPPRTMAAVVAPLMAKMASGTPLTPAEQSALDTYSAGRGRRGGGAAPGGGAPTQTRRNPATGKVVHLINGQWVEGK